MKTFSLKIIITTALVITGILTATATNYYTAKDGKWNQKNTWAGKNKPNWVGSGDTVFVDHNIELNNTTIAGVIIISQNGSITGNGNLNINSTGEVIAENNISVKHLKVWGGSLTTNSDLEVSHHIDITDAGSVLVEGALINGKNVTLNSGVTLEVVGGASSISGNLNINGGTLIIGGDFVISGQTKIHSGSDITNDGTLTSNNQFEVTSSGAVITNNGTLTTNGSFSNNGTINNEGTFNANGDFTNDWNGEFNNDGDLFIDNDITNNNIINNDGDIEATGDMLNNWGSNFVNNGTSFIDGDIDNNGTISGSGSTLVTGTLDTQNGSVTGDGYVCNPDQTTDPTGGNQTNVNSDVTICGQTDGTFPVELVDFEAKASNDAVELKWTTATEINNDYFTVQRATENGEFEAIATVDGAGNSNELIDYTFVDYSAPAGQNVYYRIKQTDFDGTTSYSWILDITNKEDIIAKVYPSPAKRGEKVTVQSSVENVNVSMYDMQGNQILSEKMNHNQFDVYTNDLKPGMYFIKLQSENGSDSVTEKLIIQ